MQDGYLIVKCLRCGSKIFLKIGGLKDPLSQCPVCAEYALSVVQIQPGLEWGTEMTRDVNTIPEYINSFLENAIN